MNKKTFGVAFGGVISALCIALEFSVGIFPVFLYVFPMICSLLMSVLMEECGAKTAWCAYAGISVLSLLVCPDKEAALMYAVFFGYYPMIRVLIQKLKRVLIRLVIKLWVFNTAIVLCYGVFMKLFGLSGDEGWGMWFLILILVLGNVAFILFDRYMDIFHNIYTTKYRGKIFGSRRK